MVSPKAPEPSFLWPSCMEIKPSVAWIFFLLWSYTGFPRNKTTQHSRDISRELKTGYIIAVNRPGTVPQIAKVVSTPHSLPQDPRVRYDRQNLRIDMEWERIQPASISCHEREGCLPLTPHKSSSRGGLVKQLIPEDVRNLRIQESWGLRYRPG